jgi:tripartite-type tricarboxylate transporter receptor subunit TctC
MQRRFTLKVLAGALAIAAIPCATLAQGVADYPNRPVKLVVNLPPGGAVDTFARLLVPQLTEALGKPVIVENRAGAGGTIGSNYVAKSPADGYTLLMVYDTFAANPHVYKDLPFDTFKDLAPITILASAPLAIVVPTKLMADNLKEFNALSKSKPNGLNYASGGAGSSGHLTAELFASAVGARLTHVPYKGGGPALLSAISAETDMTILGTTIVVPQIRNGLLKAIAVTSKDRAQSLPNVPTIREQGYPEFEVNSWYGVLAPSGTPRPIIDKVRNAFLSAMKFGPTAKRMSELDINYMGTTPEKSGAFIVSESAKWGKVVKDNNIKLD